MEDFKIGDKILNFQIIKEFQSHGNTQIFLAKNIIKDDYYSLSNDQTKNVVIKIIWKNNDLTKQSIAQWEKAFNEYKITRIISSRTNENVVVPLDWGQGPNGDYYFIITKYIDGPSLAKYLSINKIMNVNRAMRYFEQLANGIKFFHEFSPNEKIIHRDIKTENLIFTKDLRNLKIIDYGIATFFYENSLKTNENKIYCTASYTTPDILRLSDKKISKYKDLVSVQFDFHSLGIVLYEMIIGELPFKSDRKESDTTKIKKWLKYDIDILKNLVSNIPNSVENIIFRCTASKPEDIKYRYKNINELLIDIKKWNNAERINEKLLKAINERVLEKYNDSNNILKDKKNINKILVWVSLSFLLLIIIILVVVLVV